jgi:uncharacterized RDD family membrane protein YckC
MNWYYARGDERMGPVDEAQILALAATGQITAQTLVWREGMADWVPWGHAPRPLGPDEAGAPYPMPAADEYGYRPCAECGRTFLVNEMLRFENVLVCGECKPIFFQRLREGGQVYSALKYAGFWIRGCATIVDVCIMFVVTAPLEFLEVWRVGSFEEYMFGEMSMADIVFTVMSSLFGMMLALAYDTWFVGKFGATPGKRILGLRVVRSDGSRVTYKRALGRSLATWLSQLTLCIGFIIAAFDDQKRTLHDHICDTRVVHK